MASDVVEAQGLLTSTLNTAFDAAREHTAAINAVGLEEIGLWEQVGAVVVPFFDPECLHTAAVAVGEPQLPSLLASRDQTRAAQEEARAGFEGSMLDAAELKDLSTRRQRIDTRLTADRGRYKELRSRPGLLDRVDEFRKGARLKEDLAAQVRAYEELRANVEALETEFTRLAAVAARHHRAKIRLAELDDQLAALDAGSLRDARRIVVDRLMNSSTRFDTHVQLPALKPLFRTIDGVCAKRTILNAIFDSWLRPHGALLIELQNEGVGVRGFETVSWPAKVDLHCREAAIAIDAFRRTAVDVVAFAEYDRFPPGSTADWWSALLPGVPNPNGTPASQPAHRDVADVASDKLSAAWAALDDVEASALAEAPEVTERRPNMEAMLGGPPSTKQGLPPTAHRANLATATPDGTGWPQAGPGDDDPFSEPTRNVPRTTSVVIADLARPSFAPGSKVGRCIVDALIGRGGMGEVYRGRLQGEAGFSRAVVLKRLSLDRGDDDGLVEAFAREAEIAARIAHPNVVQIFDVQSAGGEPFIVMELLEGLTLQKLVTRAEKEGFTIDLPVIVRCALDAARGLHAAHSMRSDDGALVGLVHRDVSPDNLFLCQNGFTKLLDFGIARRNDLQTMTGKSELKGKIPYMSPEQIMGDPLDARSDLFSLGATLYWILSGQRPFGGDNEVTTLYAVVNKPHKAVRTLRAQSGPFGDVIELLLQKRRDDRPASALAVAQLLERCAPATPDDAAAFLARVWA